MDVEGLMKSMHALDYIKSSLQHLEIGLKMAKEAAKKVSSMHLIKNAFRHFFYTIF